MNCAFMEGGENRGGGKKEGWERHQSKECVSNETN